MSKFNKQEVDVTKKTGKLTTYKKEIWSGVGYKANKKWILHA